MSKDMVKQARITADGDIELFDRDHRAGKRPHCLR